MADLDATLPDTSQSSVALISAQYNFQGNASRLSDLERNVCQTHWLIRAKKKD
jgi:hypothetical protein